MKKFVYGWWITKEDQHFESYFFQSVQAAGKRRYQPQHMDRCFLHIKNRRNTAILLPQASYALFFLIKSKSLPTLFSIFDQSSLASFCL